MIKYTVKDNIMKVRRYKKEGTSIKTYYEDIVSEADDDDYYGDSYNAWNGWKQTSVNPPKGTKRTYLDEFKDWGFSEDKPEPYRSTIYSKGMKEKVKALFKIGAS